MDDPPGQVTPLSLQSGWIAALQGHHLLACEVCKRKIEGVLLETVVMSEEDVEIERLLLVQQRVVGVLQETWECAFEGICPNRPGGGNMI